MSHDLRLLSKWPSVILLIISEYVGTGCCFCDGSNNEDEFYPVLSTCPWVQADDSFNNSPFLPKPVKFKIHMPFKTNHSGMAYGMVYRCFDGTFYLLFDNRRVLLNHGSNGMLKLRNFLNCDSTLYHCHYKPS
jgi:hypothetical protein